MSVLKYMNKKIDSILIVSTLAKIAFDNFDNLNNDELMVLQAFKRANPKFENSNLVEISDYLQGLNDEQLTGLSNNIKGVLHEIQFIEIENDDGDSVSAALFQDTNHPDMDIILTDNTTGEISEIQLKATDSSSYVEDWIDEHPDGDILITEELAEKMNLETTRISNNKLTTDVNEFVEKIIELDNNDSLWSYFPTLPAISITISSYALFKMYHQNKISFEVLKIKFIKLTGIKIAKFSMIAVLMMIPIVNVMVGAGLLYSLLYGTGSLVNNYLSKY